MRFTRKHKEPHVLGKRERLLQTIAIILAFISTWFFFVKLLFL